jgi:hypothetical protein
MNVGLKAAFEKAVFNMARPARFVQNDVVGKHGKRIELSMDRSGFE